MARIEFRLEPCDTHGKLVNLYIDDDFYYGYSPDFFNIERLTHERRDVILPKPEIIMSILGQAVQAGKTIRSKEVSATLKGLMS